MILYVILVAVVRFYWAALKAMAFVWYLLLKMVIGVCYLVIQGVILAAEWGVDVAWPAVMAYVHEARAHH